MATPLPERSLVEKHVSSIVQEQELDKEKINTENAPQRSAEPEVAFPTESENFETVNLDADGEDEDEEDGSDQTGDRPKRKRLKKKKKQTRLFNESSDSSSDEDGSLSRRSRHRVDPSDLTWPLWVWYYIVAVSSGALRAAEYLGEKLAAFFGITTPKYQYIIDEYHRLKAQEKEEEEAERREMEYAAKMEAERLGLLEGGSGPSDVTPKENGTLPESAEVSTVPEVMVQNTVPVIPT